MMETRDLLLSAALQQKMGYEQIMPTLDILVENHPEYAPVRNSYIEISHQLILIIKALKEMEGKV